MNSDSSWDEKGTARRWEDVGHSYRGAGFPLRHRAKIKGKGLTLAGGQEFFERVIPEKLGAAVDALASTGGSLILFGPRGTGKTLLATWLSAQEGYRAAQDGEESYILRYAVWPDLLAEEKRRFDGDSNDVLRKAKKANLLVLDEVFEALSTDWERNQLTRLIDFRYWNCLRTVIVGNVEMDAMGELLGASAFSRLSETGPMLHCNWEPYR